MRNIHWSLALAVAMNADLPGGVAVAGEFDTVDVGGERIGAHAFGPLDDDDGVLVGEEFVEVDGMGGARAFVQTIEIEMVELETSGVRVYECERGTCDIFLVDA